MTLQPPTTYETGRYHWTVETFYRAIAAGIFDEPNRLELIQGEIWKKEPVNPPYANVTEDTARLFRSLFEPQFWVREEKPFHIAFDGEPVPDIAVVAAEARHDRSRHPTPEEVRLLVEVADSSAERDLGEKAALYAQAGIADYWVSLLNTRQLVVHRNPTDNQYASVVCLTETDSIAPLVAPDTVIAIADLLPRVVSEVDTV